MAESGPPTAYRRLEESHARHYTAEKWSSSPHSRWAAKWRLESGEHTEIIPAGSYYLQRRKQGGQLGISEKARVVRRFTSNMRRVNHQGHVTKYESQQVHWLCCHLAFRMQSMSESVRQDQKVPSCDVRRIPKRPISAFLSVVPLSPLSACDGRTGGQLSHFLVSQDEIPLQEFRSSFFAPRALDQLAVTYCLQVSLAVLRVNLTSSAPLLLLLLLLLLFPSVRCRKMRRLWPSDSCRHRNYVSVGKASMSGRPCGHVHLNWIGGEGDDTRD